MAVTRKVRSYFAPYRTRLTGRLAWYGALGGKPPGAPPIRGFAPEESGILAL